MHGWAIGQRLTQVSGEQLQVSDGSLYPALHKLEQQGLITARWKKTDLGRRAKFYALTLWVAVTLNTRLKTGNVCRPRSAGSSG